jgi:hypothetical protein
MEDLPWFSNSSTALSPNGTTGIQLQIYAGFSSNIPNYTTYILFDEVELNKISDINKNSSSNDTTIVSQITETITKTAEGFTLVFIAMSMLGLILIRRKRQK